MLVFIMFQAVGYAFFGLVRDPYLAAGLAVINGLVQGFVTVNITTILQITTPGEIRGRIFGILATISSSLAPLAMGLAGVIADLVDQNIPAIYIVSGAIMTVVVVIVSFNPHFRKFLASDGELESSDPMPNEQIIQA